MINLFESYFYWVVPGLGMFAQSYNLFAIGNLK